VYECWPTDDHALRPVDEKERRHAQYSPATPAPYHHDVGIWRKLLEVRGRHATSQLPSPPEDGAGY
jgi:hypothetical protein